MLSATRADLGRAATRALGARPPPDPPAQRHVITHCVAALSATDREFDYRFNAYRMNRNLQG